MTYFSFVFITRISNPCLAARAPTLLSESRSWLLLAHHLLSVYQSLGLGFTRIPPFIISDNRRCLSPKSPAWKSSAAWMFTRGLQLSQSFWSYFGSSLVLGLFLGPTLSQVLPQLGEPQLNFMLRYHWQNLVVLLSVIKLARGCSIIRIRGHF